MESATAVGGTTTESTTAARSTAAESTAAMEAAIPAELVTAAESTAAAKVAESLTTAEPAVIAPAEITIARPVVAAMEATEPGTRADKNAGIKIVGAVIPVRCARVRVIPIVAIGAAGRRTDVARTNSNANSKLRVGSGACEDHEKPKQTDIF
jgi:hypothetical protein